MRITGKLACAATVLLLGLAPAEATTWGPGNFSGPYGFRLLGLDKASTGTWVVATGEFSADGNKGISGGSITYNDGGDVCLASIASTSSYNVISDGEGTLTLQLTGMSGSCPIGPTFTFAIAIAAPNGSLVATLVDMNSTSVGENGGNVSNIMIYGAANRL